MNKDLFKTIVFRSLIPLYCIIMFFAHTYVSDMVLFGVMLIILIFIITHNADKNKKNASQSVTIRGLIHASMAAPLMFILGFSFLIGIGFGFEYLEENIGKTTTNFIVFMIIILIWTFDIVFTVKKNRKKT